jgi:hypothetical protein
LLSMGDYGDLTPIHLSYQDNCQFGINLYVINTYKHGI